jgi:hypothetical protein
MRRSFTRELALGIALVVAGPQHPAEAESVPPRAQAIAELSAGPLFSIDRPLRGCSGEALVGIGFTPFEAGIRAGGAYDASWETGDLRFDLVLGLGSGLRAIVGCLLFFDKPALPDPGGACVSATVADWPNRFGIGATLAQLPWRFLGAELDIDSELVYTAYRVEAETALSGAAAFAAGVEAKLAFRLRWEPRAHP